MNRRSKLAQAEGPHAQAEELSRLDHQGRAFPRPHDQQRRPATTRNVNA